MLLSRRRRQIIDAGSFAADAPYAGKWKMNAAKSNFGESTVTYEQLPGGEMKTTMDGLSYTFKTDGKDNMTPWGMTVAVKAVDAKTCSVLPLPVGNERRQSCTTPATWRTARECENCSNGPTGN